MYANVCVIALIFWSLENVSGCRSLASWSQESSKSEYPVNTKDIQDLTCVQRYQYGEVIYVFFIGPIVFKFSSNQQKAIAEKHITSQQTIFTTAHFIIKVEKFDNNTEIYCTMNGNKPHRNATVVAKIGENKSVLDLSNESTFYKKTLINVTNETPITNEEAAVLKYNGTRNVTFRCPEHIIKTNNTQLGIINPSSNMIETLQDKTLNQSFEITHNGTILCCIYYVVNGTEEKWITRYVTNKTLLVYDDSNNYGDNDNRQQDTLKGTEMTVDNTNTYTDDIEPGSQTNTYVITTAAVGAVFILITVIVIWKKRCRKKPKSDAKVLYAELDILRQTEPETSQRPRPRPEEESPYAQIIGEMRPQ